MRQAFKLINCYLARFFRPERRLFPGSAGGSASCNFCIPTAEGRARTTDGVTEGMCIGLPVFTAWLSGQVETELWNDKCLTGGSTGQSVSTGGKWCGIVRCWLYLQWSLLGNRKSWIGMENYKYKNTALR